MAISRSIAIAMERGSWIRRMFEEGTRLKALYGEDQVFDLSLGNPVIEPPEAFFSALHDAIAHAPPGMHRYMANAGYPATRAAVADALTRHAGHRFVAEQVVMTVGAGGGLNIAFKAILDQGDEVIIIRPFFPEYLFYVANHGGCVVPVDCRADDFGLDLEAIAAALGPRTRAVVLNSPNNPAGTIYDSADIAALGELLRKHQQQLARPIYLIGDEPYRKLVYDGASVPWIFDHYRQSLLVTSHSKDLSLPGERIGYVAVGPDCQGCERLVAALTFANRTLGYVNAPALMQRVVAQLQDVAVDLSGYTRLRDQLYSGLVACGYQVVKPRGAFYMFPRALEADDVAFMDALRAHKVLVVPGTGFGMPGHFRISYAVEERVIAGALEGFASVARDYGAVVRA